MLRVVIQCMLPDAPKDLSVEAQNLANKVTTLIPSCSADGMSSGLQERCPACDVEIPLTDIAVATCLNGHRWRESLMTSDMRSLKLIFCWPRDGLLLTYFRLPALARCSVTSFILSTTMVQTCLGCARKAFLPAVRSQYQQDRGREPNSGVGLSERSTAEDPRTDGDSGIVNVPVIGRGWIMQELLKAVRRCLFCGNNFSILI